MYRDKRIGVVIPCFNEERLIERTITTIPNWVDRMIVVDDGSHDKSVVKIKELMNELKDRLILIEHGENKGVGSAIVSGYKKALEEGLDVVCVMAGDSQMDPEDLTHIISPVVSGKADYVKGNRLFTGEAWKRIPKYRYLGNSILSLLTKIASGYWHVADSQSGYTAITRDVLDILDLDSIYSGYGYTNDLLVRLNVYNFRVKDVSINPIYNIGEKSRINLLRVIPSISFLLLRRFFWRLKEKYVIRDFHPLVFFYLMSFLLLPAGVVFGAYLIYLRLRLGGIALPGVILDAVLLISGFQSLFFAFWFDMDYNKDLK
ncbi:MAG: glycosyltransferase family 2 protein [bacterium]|nr:glycosyltransferase family 2 protein [bacterium]